MGGRVVITERTNPTTAAHVTASGDATLTAASVYQVRVLLSVYLSQLWHARTHPHPHP